MSLHQVPSNGTWSDVVASEGGGHIHHGNCASRQLLYVGVWFWQFNKMNESNVFKVQGLHQSSRHQINDMLQVVEVVKMEKEVLQFVFNVG